MTLQISEQYIHETKKETISQQEEFDKDKMFQDMEKELGLTKEEEEIDKEKVTRSSTKWVKRDKT